MSDLREAGTVTSGARPFGPKDRSAFLDGMERVMRQAASARGA